MEKKMLPPAYNPKEVEDKWYRFWLEKNYFRAEIDPARRPFSIVIPPPNVTGALHMGHALDNTLQDIIIRWRRMQGYATLWMPGTDHAGIATQVKVEESLREQGLSKEELGREGFLEKVWDWKARYGGQIRRQLEKLGASCDWSRERFTLDEGLSAAVREVFVRLYEKGLIYRGKYIINWCPDCHTAISDIEVEHEEEDGHLWYLRYPLADGSGFITVATTRPETMLGDTAVAVHPEDERYRALIGRTAILPLVGRRIPIIAEAAVDREFGTGAVKVTPAHDPNDFEMGLRHNLEQVVVIDDRGRMTAQAGAYQGLDRYAARRQVLADLKAQGLLEREEPHRHSVGHCYRCATTIEPMVSEQWFVKMKPLAEPALRVVREGQIKLIPERFTKVYLNWLENIRDWCISRQLWWGHRIPAWYCQDCGATIVRRQEPRICPHCGSAHLEQDPDVLDTWFSSALWPFSTMGWPKETPEMKCFFPTSVLVTGYDIIFFWVARMIFTSLEFTGQIPFHYVLIHGLVRDAQGRKMSKSLGNGIDPLDVVRDFGADTLRFMLVTGNTPGNDLRFYWERVEGSRNFANKLWNASRFVLMNLEGFDPAAVTGGEKAALFARLTRIDRWILSRYQSTVKKVTELLEDFDLGEAGRTLYDFIWSELCDWYIELVKPRFYRSAAAAATNGGDDESGDLNPAPAAALAAADRQVAQFVLWTVLEGTLRLLHPFMPFITEEIWQHLPYQGESIMAAPWPAWEEELIDAGAEKDVGLLMEVIRGLRNLRAEVGVPTGKKADVVLWADDDRILDLLREHETFIRRLGAVDQLTLDLVQETKPERAVAAMAPGVEIYLPLAGLIDLEKEVSRLTKELETAEKDLVALRARLNNPGFLQKAPPQVVEKEKERLGVLQEKAEKIRARLRRLTGK
ncbi:MAG: valine--tRNA ligase [Firmicutes bacterium]|nr:valine--tRNA ligase [Bacillota bacterium]MCL5039687.1 valine--tRNA ligase [Bacillota bacterium]